MTNMELVRLANATGDIKSKNRLRDEYQSWCAKNQRTPFDEFALRTWLKEDGRKE